MNSLSFFSFSESLDIKKNYFKLSRSLKNNWKSLKVMKGKHFDFLKIKIESIM